MPRYGTRKYGDQTFIYGAGSVSALSVEPFQATAVDYTSVSLSWLNPTGGYSAMRLVRNQDGVPDTAEDGVILIDEQVAQTTRNTRVWQDSADNALNNANYIPLVPGKIAYYSIWVFLTADRTWFPVGNTYAFIANTHETPLAIEDGSPTTIGRTRSTHEKVMDLLPRVFTSSSGNAIDEVDYTSALSDFLYGFSYTIDELTTFLDLIQPSNSATNLTPERLALEASSLSLPPENRASTRFLRQLVREAPYIYSRKGTAKSIATFVESMTGYNTSVIPSPNLVLTNQDSTFRDWESYQDWLSRNTVTITGAVSNGSSVVYSAANSFRVGQEISVAGLVPASLNSDLRTVIAADSAHFTLALAADVGTFSGLNGTAAGISTASYTFWRRVGAGSLSAAVNILPPTREQEPNSIDEQTTAKFVAGSSSTKLSYGNDSPITQAIPVTENTRYTVSLYVKTAVTANVTLKANWYDYFGTLISTTTNTPTAANGNVWKKHALRDVAPAGACYVGVEFLVNQSGEYYLDLFQVARSSTISAISTSSHPYLTVTVASGHPFQPGDWVVLPGTTVTKSDTTVVDLGTTPLRVKSLNGSTTQLLLPDPSYPGYSSSVSVGTLIDYAYDEARGITVRMEPNKHNYLFNPSFEGADSTAVLAGWTVTTDDSGSPSRVVINASKPGPLSTDTGLTYVEVPVKQTAQVEASTIDEALTGGKFYSFSAYAKGTSLQGLTKVPVTVTLMATSYGNVTGVQLVRLSPTRVRAYFTTTHASSLGDQVFVSFTDTPSWNLNGVVAEVTSTGFAVDAPSSWYTTTSFLVGPFTGQITAAFWVQNSVLFTDTASVSVTANAETNTTNTYSSAIDVQEGEVVTITGFSRETLNVTNAVVTNSFPGGFTVQALKAPGWSTNSTSGSGSAVISGRKMLTSAWNRFSANVYVPETFTSPEINTVFSVNAAGLPNATLTKKFAIDAAQLEDRYSSSDYFDGSYQDAVWSTGEQNRSSSYMYQNKFYKLPQLADHIEPILPASTPYRVELLSGIAKLIDTSPVTGYTD